MTKYKLVQKGDPRDKKAPKKWYANPTSDKPMDTKAMTRAATQNTTTASIELEGALELFGNFAAQQLRQGHSIKVGSLGTLRLTFKSEGVDNLKDFNSNTMIKEARIIFTPSKELRESVLSGLTFENAGIIEEGVSYSSMQSYNKAKGNVDGNDNGNKDGDGDGDDENPLG